MSKWQTAFLHKETYEAVSVCHLSALTICMTIAATEFAFAEDFFASFLVTKKKREKTFEFAPQKKYTKPHIITKIFDFRSGFFKLYGNLQRIYLIVL